MNHQADNVVSELMPKDIEYQAAHWLAVLDGDSPSAEQIAAFHCWKNQDEAHRKAFEELLELWGSANILTKLEPPVNPASRLAPSPLSLFKPAAAFALLLFVSIAIVQPLFFPSEMIYTTQVGEQKTIQLPDGSELMLNTDSQVMVNYQSDHRLLTLQKGEAHFEVAHDPRRPFDVYAGSGRVTALGTAFTVRKDQRAVSVYVTEGVIEVYSDLALNNTTNKSAPKSLVQQGVGDSASVEKSEAVQVSAGNQAVYREDGDRVVAVEPSQGMAEKLSWHQGKLVFNREPLGKVIAEFERYTSVKIVIPSKKMRIMEVGGIFKIGDTVAMLDALQEGFGIHAEYVSESLVYLVAEEDQ